MKLTLRLIALAVFLTTAVWWFRAGANRGWTKNTVAVQKLDEITGIEYPDYEDRFVPGVDFVAAGTAIAALFGAASLFFGRKRPKPKTG